ncbi:hypothetical protein GO988_19400 [Hymenobacter sp. HMF4947]|uniref:Cell surface protein SprA n=1 Tax=Hymenobacter ginkgonis TaxID=2682976 RepID=A0A7K1TJG4_9BACT|nr:hypothetical protein [Hymenobacter ginkgonis]MVN78503.1 hypothetical protein [Hymenobacter ginkgonis]
MTLRYHLCFPLVGLLVAALFFLSTAAWAQQPGQGTALPPPPVPTLPAPTKAAAAAEVAPPSNRRCRYLRLAPGRDTTSFALTDTLTIVPASVSADGRSVAYDARTDRYQLVRLAPRDSSGAPLPDSVLLCYRVLPMQLLRARFRRPRGLMDSIDFRDRRMLTVEDFSQQEQILSTPGISKTGNLSRGISFGNTQNVFVNSALNLQLEGRLTENIRLTAAISDQNVPFQPEGNTQTLQQFDKIYITLTGPQWNLTAGDVVLRNKPDYFLRYYKNIQGAAVEANLGAPGPQPLQAGATNNSVSNAPPSSFTTYTNGVTNNSAAPTGNTQPTLALPTAAVPGGGQVQAAPSAPPTGTGAVTVLDKLGQVRSSTLIAGGVAKGKFASIDLAPLENVQGPYRLTGPNGEQFIIVLAGSERVYIDGRLQTRGFDYDYTIDYNLAEITFSPRHLITTNTRLKVDFEYSDLNYARSLYTVSHYQQVGKLNVRGNFYQESDNPDNAANLTLSGTDLQTLRAAGNVSQVQVPASRSDSTGFNRTVVQYHRVPRLNTTTGQREYVFEYATDSLSGVYTIRFTDVGAGLGDYALSTTNANTNGRVYDYVGAGQGRYRAIRILPTPLLKQMVSGGATYQIDPTASVFVDVASSQIQRNRFALGTEDKGGAMRLGYTVQDRALPSWAPAALQKYRLRSALDYEYTAPKFAPIDRYRDIEFDRNWSTVSTANATATDPREDNILNFAVGLTRDANHAINYRLSRRYRPGEVNGLQHWVDVAQQVGRVELRGAFFLLNSQAGRYHSDWARGELNVRYGGGRLIPGYTYKFDKNKVVSPQGDTIRSANYFDEHTLYLQSPDTGRTRYNLSYSYRRDRTPTAEQNNLEVHSESQTWQGNVTTRLSKYQDLRIIASYRDLNLVSNPDSAHQRNILGKIDHTLGLLQNQIRSELTYSVQTGRELRRDYSFVAVPAGQGTHYYSDVNGDGVQQKDEFFEAQTSDAQYRTYIKVYLPTADYITAYQSRLSYRLTVAAPRGWRDAGGWQAALARFSSVSSITVDRRTTSPGLLSRISPFSFNKEDDKLLAFNQLIRNTLYFNRANPIFGAELTVQQTQQKTLLTQGFDLRNLNTQSLLLRRTLAQSFTGRLTTARDIREAQTDYNLATTSLSGRNYKLLIYTVQPEISYQPSPSFRLTGSLLHTSKQNILPTRDADINATFDDLGLETRLSQVSKRTVTAATHVTRVAFPSDPSLLNSVVGLEILQALRPGTNYTWNLNIEQRLANGLNINVAYDGRKANGVGVVHTGRMQVAVLF